jgi:hypothetical protein
MSALCRPLRNGIWNLLACQHVSIGGSLHIGFAQALIGVHNEHFLHHRRRGRCTSRCRLLWSARLNSKILFDLFLANAYVRLLTRAYGGYRFPMASAELNKRTLLNGQRTR